MTSLGKITHLRRLQNSASGRILTVAIDHAPSYGVLAGLEDVGQVIRRVAAGGPRLETDEDVLHMAYNVVQAGAAGITFGRNIWQSPDVPAMIRALSAVVHHGSPVADAMGVLKQGGGV